MIENGRSVTIYKNGLAAQELCILLIRLRFDIKADQGTIRDRKHVVKPKKTELPTVQFHDMMPGFDIDVVRLW